MGIGYLVLTMKQNNGYGDLNNFDTDTVVRALKERLIKVVSSSFGNIMLTAKGYRKGDE